MYSIHGFGTMIDDAVRMDAYARAIERTVVPGSVVIDLGAGTGIMSLLALQRGARRVYAIEPASAAELIPALARENGFEDRVTVLRQRSTEVELPERAHVILSDLRGVLPLRGTHLRDLADARARLLEPGGVVVPESDTLFVAPCAAREPYESARSIWARSFRGLSQRAALRAVDNVWTKVRSGEAELLAPPVPWARIDYASPPALHVRGAAHTSVERGGTAHGLLVWFDAQLVDDVGFSNHPAGPPTIYGQGFFPWPQPVVLEPGDTVAAELRADFVSGEYVWTWTTEIQRRSDSTSPAHRFRQSEYLALPLRADALRKRAESFEPQLDLAGEAALHALRRMHEARTSLGALADELARLFPARFSSAAEALDFVCELSERFAR